MTESIDGRAAVPLFEGRFPSMSLEECGVSVLDCEHKTPVFQESGHAYIAIPNIRDGRLDLSNVARISDQDLSDWTRRTVPRADDLIVTRRGRVGDSAPVPAGLRCAIGQNLVILRSSGKVVDQKYLRWAMRGPMHQTQVEQWLNVGAVFDSLNVRDFRRFKIFVPPLPEQRAIAAVLGALDDKIELNRRMNRTLEALAAALFRAWFVDFEPVRAKAEGRPPVGIDAATAALFPDRLVPSAVGEIPEGWKLSTLGQECNVTMGQSPPGSTYNEVGQGLPFYQGRADFGFRVPRRRVYCTSPTRLASKGDSLLSVRAPVGSLNMATESCAVGRGVAALRHRCGSASYTYYQLMTMAPQFDPFNGEGTVFGSVSRGDLLRLPVPAPAASLIECFHEQVSPFDARILLNEAQNSTLNKLRDTLLPRLLSGELRVRQAEALVP